MILGVGTDIIEIERIHKVFEQRGEKFRDRVFTTLEWDYCFTYKEPFTHLAARFAAKEAYYKCLGYGVLAFHEIEVFNHPTGKPEIRLHGGTLEQWQQAGSPLIHISLSHNKLVANAVVILEIPDINPGG